MSKTLKNTKQILAFVLAFALLAVSMFTGVGFTASAATKDKVVYFTMDDKDNWGEDSSYLNSEGRNGSAEHPYLISTPAHLRHLAKKSTYEGTVGKYFEIDPTIKTIVFQREKYVNDVLGGLDTFLTKDADTVKTLLSTADNRVNFATSGGKFSGHLNGNGVEFVGLYTDQGGFCYEVDSVASFENISFKNNYITSADYAGMVFGKATATNTNTVVEMSNIEVANCYIESTSKNQERAGVLYGGLVVNWSAVKHFGSKVTNLFVHDNKAFVNTNVEVGVFGTSNSAYSGLDADKPQNLDFSNSVILDCAPYCLYDNNQGTRSQWYKNIYTNNACEIKPAAVTAGWCQWKDYDITIISKENLKGATAKTTMPKLDWNKVWFATEDSPTLRVFHTLKAKINTNDKYAGHIEYCKDCNIQGVTAISHDYDSVNKCKDCGYEKNPLDAKCGQQVVYWSGEYSAYSTSDHTGNEEDPYIIENAEQLAYLLYKVDAADSTGKYFKLSDSIDTIIMQPKSVVNASDIKALDSADSVATYFENLSGKKNLADGYVWKTFNGTLDGNNVQIYGVYASHGKGAAGLFAQVDGNTTIKNLAVKNSYFKTTASGKTAAALVGETYGIGYGAMVDGTVNLNNIAVTNNYIKGSGASGTVIGNASDDKVNVDTCLSFGNKSSEAALPMVANNATAISNTISIDATPIVNGATYTNVYTNVSVADTTGVTVITATKGNAIKEQANTLNWDTVWFAGEKMPILRSFHVNFVAEDNDDGTHVLKCNCGEKSEDVAHNYNKTSGNGVCLDCGAQCKHKYIDKNVIQAGDCVTDRIAHQVCEWCGNDKGNVTTVATGHTFTHVDYKAATCKAAGNVEHLYCSKCGNCFDKDADTFAAMSTAFDATIEQLSHTPITDENGDIVYKMNGVQHWKVCANDYCGEEYDIETHIGDYAYDGADGHHVLCTVCCIGGDTTVPHEYGDDSICDLCGYVNCDGNSDNHVFVKIAGVVATCKANGIKEHVQCKYCKQKASVNDHSKLYSDEDIIIAAGKHHVTAVAITNDTNAHYVCDDCGKYFADASATMEVTSDDLAFGTTIGSNGAANADTSNTSPKTSETSATPIALVTALVGVAFVTFRKVKKA